MRLLRFPTVAAAVVAAAAIAAVSLGVAPLLVSSGGSSAVRDGIDSLGDPPTVLTAVSTTSFVSGNADPIEEIITEQVRGLPLLPPAVTALGPAVSAQRLKGRRSTSIQLVTRRGFQDHVDVVAGPSGGGVWIPKSVADDLGIGPGDHIKITGIGVTVARPRVAAVYRDITLARVPNFWAPVLSRIRPRAPDAATPPPFLQADLDLFADLIVKLRETGRLEFTFSPSTSLTLPEAEALASRLSRLAASASDPAAPVHGVFTSITTSLPGVVRSAERTVEGTTQPIRAISLAGGLLALAVAGVTARFMARRRRSEFAMLSARGVGPARLGLRTVVEGMLPAALGAAAGWIAARLLVDALGPGGEIDAEALRSAGVVVVGSAVVALATLGVVAGASIRSEGEADTEQPNPARARARVPWEAVALALAAASLYEILHHAPVPPAAALADSAKPHVDLLVLLFPFLFVAGTVGLAVRWIRRALPPLRTAVARRSPSSFIAVARLSSAPRLAATLVTSAALGVGILVYATVLASSIASTAEEKASLSIGSDVVVTVGSPPTIPGNP
ncbi:MAG TPA: hypothetical protein VNC85_02095, partial [Mycobacteriales bacterium]|nr:hypothetical protein [Mycobacteriales bacterium]